MTTSSYNKHKTVSTYKSELHAVSQLPMEIFREQLQRIEDKQVHVITRQFDNDVIDFEIKHRRDGHINAEIYGTIRRWQGTHSRIDADSRLHIPGVWLNVVVTLGLWLLICATIFGFWMSFAAISPNMGRGLGIIVSVAISGFIINYLPDIDYFRDKTHQARKDVDYLMQEIADAIDKPATTGHDLSFVEFDGSDDALTRLLQQYPDTIHVGDDGEIET